jgi:hypothetical protein
VGEERDAAGSLDLIGDPVPVADALERNGCSFGELSEEAMYSSGLVVDPCLADDMAAIVLNFDLGVPFVGVTADPIIAHAAPPVKMVGISHYQCSGRCSAFM